MDNSVKFTNLPIEYARHTQNVDVKKKDIAPTQDTLVTGHKQSKTPQVQIGKSPKLPKAQKSTNQGVLATLAEAFADAFKAQSKGLITQTKNFAQDQQLNQIMSSYVLKSQTIVYNMEESIQQIKAKIFAYQKKMAGEINTVSDVVRVVGIVVIGITLASALFDGGASLFAAAGEASFLGMATAGGETVAEGAAETVAEEGEASLATNAQETAEESWTKYLAKQAGKRTFGAGVGAGFGAPDLMKFQESRVTYSLQKQASTLEQESGSAISKLQVNNAYFQFFQKMLKRVSSVIQEENNGASQIVETFSDITNGYQHISYGLSNAV